MLRIYLVVVAVFLFMGIHAQKEELARLESFHPFPGKGKPLPNDLDAAMTFEADRDSFYFTLTVKDDQVVSNPDYRQSDRVEVWFAMPEAQFSDFITGKMGKTTRIFRNSAEPGDNADLTRFVEKADYPSGPLEFEGKSVKTICPARKELREERVFYGMSHFAFAFGSKSGIQLDRDRYEPLRSQLGGIPDDLSGKTRCKSEPIAGGYRMTIAMHHTCLAFAQPVIKNLRYCVDVADRDAPTEQEQWVSSTPNRFYARPYYFAQVALNQPINVSIPNVPQAMLDKSGLQLNLYYGNNRWNAYGNGASAIVYAEGIVSEAGLVDFTFHPIQIRSESFEGPNKISVMKMVLDYDDETPFHQQDVYFLIGDELVISRGYSYQREEKSDFVNSLFALPDGRLAMVLYDFEPADPAGWGEYGKMADEFVYIQTIGKQGRSIFSGGHRKEVAHTASFGELDKVQCDQVKEVVYSWIKPGQQFQIDVKGLTKANDKRYTFSFSPSGDFRLDK